jgi:glycerate kinase
MFMSEKEAIKEVENALLGEDSIPGKLAMKKGIDAAAVVKLEEAMSYLTKAFETGTTSPKRLLHR